MIWPALPARRTLRGRDIWHEYPSGTTLRFRYSSRIRALTAYLTRRDLAL